MTNAKIDNSIGAEAAILWQYDHAPNLLALIGKEKGCLSKFLDVAVTDFWDSVRDKILNADREQFEGNEFTPWDNPDPGAGWLTARFDVGLDILGTLMGVPRPQIKPKVGEARFIMNKLYRRLILSKAYVYGCRGTIPELNRFLAILFGTYFDGNSKCSRSRVIERFADAQEGALPIGVMAAEVSYPYYGEGESEVEAEDAELLYRQHYGLVLEFPAGVLTNLAGPRYDGIIGLNEERSSQEQRLCNYAPYPAAAGDALVNGGIFSETDEGMRTGFYESLDVLGSVICDSSSGKTVSVEIAECTGNCEYITWGDGSYTEVRPSTLSYSHAYAISEHPLACCVRASASLVGAQLVEN